MQKMCPGCHTLGSLREIIYGLPAEPINESEFLIGGCCVGENDPSFRCIECNWEGEFKNHIRASISTELRS